ncbi:MAG TPA: DUF881 domain-containing protein [Aldersonia sp.]
MNSLLTPLLSEHLDPSYEAAARDRDSGHARPSTVPAWVWLTLGVLLVGIVVGVAWRHTVQGPGDARAELADTVRAAQQRTAELAAEREGLAGTVEAQREAALTGNAAGANLLDRVHDMSDAAAAQPVRGPGITVTLADADTATGATEADSGRSIVLDRDLQDVVNGLWASGAEAVAVSGVRIGPGVTVRQAGAAVLVDNSPVRSPYRVEAIGPPGRLETDFVRTDTYLRMSGLAQLYGVGFEVHAADDLELPAAAVREIRVAREEGE